MADGSIFRKKSLDRAASPEQLDQYIKVSSPGAWAVLAVLALLLVVGGAAFALASVPRTQEVHLTVSDGRVQGSAEGLADGEYDVEVAVGEQSLADLVFGR